jgi:hypothetical protein
MEIYSCTHYNYNEHYSTESFSGPTDRTVLHRRLTWRTDLFCFQRLTDDSLTRWRRLTNSLRSQRLTLTTHWLPRNAEYHCWLRIHRPIVVTRNGATVSRIRSLPSVKHVTIRKLHSVLANRTQYVALPRRDRLGAHTRARIVTLVTAKSQVAERYEPHSRSACLQ